MRDVDMCMQMLQGEWEFVCACVSFVVEVSKMAARIYDSVLEM